jgi:hypothetical protein
VSEVGSWRVSITVPPEDVQAVRNGAARTLAAERHALITEDRPDAEDYSLLAVEVPAIHVQDAIWKAVAAYQRARHAVGLQPDPNPAVIGATSPIFRDRVWQLREEADHMVDQGQYDLAVVRAQTACELWIQLTLKHAFTTRLLMKSALPRPCGSAKGLSGIAARGTSSTR